MCDTILVAGAVKDQRTQRQAVGMLRAVFGSPYLGPLCRVVLGAVFLYAGATKVFDPASLAASIRSYELGLPNGFVMAASRGLPLFEVLLGLYLIIGLFTKPSAWAANGLLLIFTLAILQGALRGLDLDCGCFGGGAAASGPTNPWVDVARDLGLLALGLVVALGPRSRFAVDGLLRTKTRGPHKK